jgi:cellulose synthase/poly-beta-1,6-N-acetylglucosamine synthase-like glycosyltransferase
MNIRQELAVVQQCSRILYPAHVMDVLRTRSLHGQCAEATMLRMGALARAQFAKARTNPESVAVVIPAHNEAEQLPATLAALARTGNALPIVVDNRSTDATPEIARRMGAELLDQPTGKKMAATKRGLRFVLDELRRTDAVFIDADTLVLPGYARAMTARLDETDEGGGVGVFGSSYRMFGKSRTADAVTTLTNFRDNIKRGRNGNPPVPHGHTYALRFDAAGVMERNLMALPDDLWVSAAECGVADDVAIFRAIVAAGAVAVGSAEPDSLVLTENRIESFGQLWAMHRGATWEEVTGASYTRQYGPPEQG